MKKIKCCISCGGGFSSSTMAEYIKNGILENHLEEELEIQFLPFHLSSQRLDEFDILILCPHLVYPLNRFLKKNPTPHIPIYLLPIKMYGPVDIQEVYQDIKDLLAMYEKEPVCPIHFPNETNCLKIPRLKAYRNVHPDFTV